MLRIGIRVLRIRSHDGFNSRISVTLIKCSDRWILKIFNTQKLLFHISERKVIMLL